MHSRLLGGTVAAAIVAGLMVAATAPAAHAADPVEVTQADFVAALGDTRSAGHYDFTADGIHLWTDNATSQAKVAEYFELTGSLADMVGSTPPVWSGTGIAPGSQIVFDADGTLGNNPPGPPAVNETDFNILVGESAYGGDDWWLTGGSSTAAKAVCPETGGGFGSACHGTLEQWAAVLPAAKVYAGGFSLGSSVHGDGVLTGLRFGSTDYTFAGLGMCDVAVNHGTKTFTLQSDCTTTRTLRVDDGWTLDGAGHTITATETPVTNFDGAVLQNSGTSMNVRNLTVTTSGWDKPVPGSGAGYGIKFLKSSGTVSNVTVSGISHGNGAQIDRAIVVDNTGTGTTRQTVAIDGVLLTKYTKSGITVDGDVRFTLVDSRITEAGGPSGAPLDTILASNSLDIGPDVDAAIRGNRITGNDWDGPTYWVGTAVLLYGPAAVTMEHNVIDGAGTDIGVAIQGDAGNVVIRCNVVSRTPDGPGDRDDFSTGISVYDTASAGAVDNTIEGFETPTDGVTNVVNQGACAPSKPAVAVSNVDASSADVSWTPAAAKAYAPVSGWELSGPGGVVTLPADTTSYHLSGLRAGRDYTVSVRALNVSGGSAWANASFDTPGPTPPVVKKSTLTVAPTVVPYGTSVTASGRLTSDGAGVAGQTVTVARAAGGSWVTVGTATTSAAGTWSLKVTPGANASLRATAAGYPTATATVGVALKVKGKVKNHKIKVKVAPNQSGRKVILFEVSKKTMNLTKVGKTRLGATSKAKFTGVAKGRYVVAARAPGYLIGVSALLKVRR